jgi:toluene monooxygenase electron transfer component
MPRITIDGSESAFDCDPDDTIARAALRAGLGYPYACNVGSCGNCRFELKEGEVAHLRADPPAWTDRDKKRGRWLGCQARPLADCRIKLRLDPQCVPAHPPERMTGRLTQIETLTHDMKEFAFDISGPDGFRPGQYALVSMPGVEGARAYSMCNLPGEREWRFQVKRVPGGELTGALFDRLAVGDEVALDGPYGTAFLREDSPRDILLMAGGSGLSPMISIARAAAASDALAERQVHFIYGGRTPRDICGEPILAGLPGFGERLHYRAAVSEAVPEADWTGAFGFVHDVAQEAFGDRLRAFEIYFAGPPAMAAAVQTMLREAEVAPDQVHYDEFY